MNREWEAQHLSCIPGNLQCDKLLLAIGESSSKTPIPSMIPNMCAPLKGEKYILPLVI